MAHHKKEIILKCLVVDDEPLAREAIVDFIAKVDFLEAVNSCASALEAQELLNTEVYDLIFLDINMPYLSGIDFLEAITNPPMVIFTTAYSQHALDGYRLQVVDYLLKPIVFKRFFQAAVKAKEWYQLKIASRTTDTNTADTLVYVKQDDRFTKIDWMNILYVEGMQNYLKLHFSDQTLIIHQTMIAIEELLPKDYFFRIHKSYLINITQIDSIAGGHLIIQNTKLPIARMRKEDLLNEVVYKKLLSR